MKRRTPADRAASRACSVPDTFVSMNDCGAAYEYGIAMRAARWNTTSTPSVAAATKRASRMSPRRMSRAARVAASVSSSQPAEPREL